MSEQDNGADVALKIAGQEINVRNVKSLNTVATLITMFAVCCIAVFLYFHEANAQQEKVNLSNTLQKNNTDIVKALKDLNDQNVSALKELTAEQRRATVQITIGNCMNEPSMKNRADARAFCERISRDR